MSGELSEQECIAAIEDGASTAQAFIHSIHIAEGGQTTQQEKVLWWGGFMAALSGIAAVSIGRDAVDVINSINGQVAARVVSERAH